jgi:FixJ family two-component response regulator
MSGQPIVTIVDDHAPHRRTLQGVVELMHLDCRAFGRGGELLDSDLSGRGCIVLDLCLPDINGLRVQEALRERGCTTPVIAMSGQADTPTAVETMKRGALDFLEKPINPTRLIDAIQQAIRHDRRMRERFDGCRRISQRLATLTQRERNVLDLIVDGLANKQIAAKLAVSQRTVETHRIRVMRKMGVDSLAQLVRAVDRVESSLDTHVDASTYAADSRWASRA